VYNGHDRMHPRKENIEDWTSAKLGPHENILLYGIALSVNLITPPPPPDVVLQSHVYIHYDLEQFIDSVIVCAQNSCYIAG
jgi:hypothetical protein